MGRSMCYNGTESSHTRDQKTSKGGHSRIWARQGRERGEACLLTFCFQARKQWWPWMQMHDVFSSFHSCIECNKSVPWIIIFFGKKLFHNSFLYMLCHLSQGHCWIPDFWALKAMLIAPSGPSWRVYFFKAFLAPYKIKCANKCFHSNTCLYSVVLLLLCVFERQYLCLLYSLCFKKPRMRSFVLSKKLVPNIVPLCIRTQ